MRQIAILGGTFDPIHYGHLLMAQTALNQVAIQQIIWVPTVCPPHKQAVKFEHRWEMVRRAIADHPAFTIAAPQQNYLQPTYAIQTLIDLQVIYPQTHWYWIVGLDTFATLPHWYGRQELVPVCDWLVIPRAMHQAEPVCRQVAHQLNTQGISIRWQLLEMPRIEISSSIIRRYCHEGHSLRYLVPETVSSYITTHQLYANGRTG